MFTADFPTTRYGATASWLVRRFQARGIGTAMRQAMGAFLFDHLDFEFNASRAFVDNPASLRVSEKIGYRDNGLDHVVRRGERTPMRRMLLVREDFVPGPPITVAGAEPLRALIGLD